MRRILIVDGDEQVTSVLELKLRQLKFDVKTLSSSVNALKMVKEYMPDLIISEMVLPELSGVDFLKRVKMNPETSEIPFIFLSSSRNVEDKIIAHEMGAESFFVKPIFIKVLINRIKDFFEQKDYNTILISPEDVNEFNGELLNISLIDLLNIIDENKKQGVITLKSANRKNAAIYFSNGQLVRVEQEGADNTQGDRILYKLLSWMEGSFVITYKPIEAEENIREPIDRLIVNAANWLNEYTNELNKLPPLDMNIYLNFPLFLENLSRLPDNIGIVIRSIKEEGTQVSDVIEGGGDDRKLVIDYLKKLIELEIVSEEPVAGAVVLPNTPHWLHKNTDETDRDEETSEPDEKKEVKEEEGLPEAPTPDLGLGVGEDETFEKEAEELVARTEMQQTEEVDEIVEGIENVEEGTLDEKVKAGEGIEEELPEEPDSPNEEIEELVEEEVSVAEDIVEEEPAEEIESLDSTSSLEEVEELEPIEELDSTETAEEVSPSTENELQDESDQDALLDEFKVKQDDSDDFDDLEDFGSDAEVLDTESILQQGQIDQGEADAEDILPKSGLVEEFESELAENADDSEEPEPKIEPETYQTEADKEFIEGLYDQETQAGGHGKIALLIGFFILIMVVTASILLFKFVLYDHYFKDEKAPEMQQIFVSSNDDSNGGDVDIKPEMTKSESVANKKDKYYKMNAKQLIAAANEFFAKEKYIDAITVYKVAVIKTSTYVGKEKDLKTKVWKNLAISYYYASLYPEALSAVEKSLLSKYSDDRIELKAAILEEMENYKKAIALYKDLLQKGDNRKQKSAAWKAEITRLEKLEKEAQKK